MIGRLIPRTLRGRLTFLITLSTAAVLGASGVGLYEALRSRIESAAIGQMQGALSALQAHLGEAASTGEVVRNAERWVDQLHGRNNMDLAIYDGADGPLLVSTSGLSTLPGLRAPPATDATLIRSPDAKLLYLVGSAVPGGASRISLRVVIQYDRAGDLALMRSYALTVVVIEVLGVMIAAALAYGIAMLGLSPLRRLIANAEDMSSSRLAHALPPLDTHGELKELERAFNGMLERLNDSFVRLSQFSSNLAHDMRTPLTNLQAAAQVALSMPRSTDEYQDVIASSIDEYQRLSRMIEDMLFLARADRAQLPSGLQKLDALAEARKVAGYYESMAEEAGVIIETRGAGHVHADRLLYQRALSNLLSNAIAHAPAGSVVRVECAQADGYTAIDVADAGKGIEAEHVQKVFERFFRVDPSRHDSAAGTGLGLAIVRSIMDLHGGECGVRSRPHVETVFWLKFPCADRPAQAGAPAAR